MEFSVFTFLSFEGSGLLCEAKKNCRFFSFSDFYLLIGQSGNFRALQAGMEVVKIIYFISLDQCGTLSFQAIESASFHIISGSCDHM